MGCDRLGWAVAGGAGRWQAGVGSGGLGWAVAGWFSPAGEGGFLEAAAWAPMYKCWGISVQDTNGENAAAALASCCWP